MIVTPTKGDGEERWSSGSRWDGGAEGETSAMDGLGGIVQAVDVVVRWSVKLEIRREMQKKIQTPRLLARDAWTDEPSQGPQAAGSRGVAIFPTSAPTPASE